MTHRYFLCLSISALHSLYNTRERFMRNQFCLNRIRRHRASALEGKKELLIGWKARFCYMDSCMTQMQLHLLHLWVRKKINQLRSKVAQWGSMYLDICEGWILIIKKIHVLTDYKEWLEKLTTSASMSLILTTLSSHAILWNVDILLVNFPPLSLSCYFLLILNKQ